LFTLQQIWVKIIFAIYLLGVNMSKSNFSSSASDCRSFHTLCTSLPNPQQNGANCCWKTLWEHPSFRVSLQNIPRPRRGVWESAPWKTRATLQRWSLTYHSIPPPGEWPSRALQSNIARHAPHPSRKCEITLEGPCQQSRTCLQLHQKRHDGLFTIFPAFRTETATTTRPNI
jgi:hypothetical protein